MSGSSASYEDLLAEALACPVDGWDFTWLRERAPITRRLPWSYPELVAQRADGAARMLDMGTGGGEALLRIPARVSFTVANEAWAPNVPVAATNLLAHGMPLVQDEGAPDNFHQDGVRGRLPYRSGSFDVVANRHEAFLANEVFRVQRPGGIFVTQQVDLHTFDNFYAALDLEQPAETDSWLRLAVGQVEQSGLTVTDARTDEERQSFRDIGVLVRYLRLVSWALPGFDPAQCQNALRRIHTGMQRAPLIVRQRRLLVIAVRP